MRKDIQELIRKYCPKSIKDEPIITRQATAEALEKERKRARKEAERQEMYNRYERAYQKALRRTT